MRIWLTGLLILLSFMSSAQLKVAVIGGGMAGVASAHFISALGYDDVEITLFEKEPQLGGNAQTVPVVRNGDTLHVDIGPQYFADGPWDDYISLLNHYDLYDKDQFSEFKASFSLHRDLQSKPEFISPKGGLRGGKLKDLIQFSRFYKSSRKIYKKKRKDYPDNVGDWVKQINCKPQFKSEVILPFLAATLGTTTDMVVRVSTSEIVKLYAFRPALRKGKFIVANQGMGTIIQNIGEQLESQGVKILRGQYAHGFKTFEERYTLSMNNRWEDQFDFVIFAVHPDQIVKILETHNPIPRLKTNLEMFRYFTADIALHTNDSYIDQRKSFMNIKSNVDNQVEHSTMNLGMIDEKYAGLYKSWVDSLQLNQLKTDGHLIKYVQFYHPIISPAFISLTQQMKEFVNRRQDIFIAGGWTLGLETQNSAVLSGKQAAQKFKAFYSSRKSSEN